MDSLRLAHSRDTGSDTSKGKAQEQFLKNLARNVELTLKIEKQGETSFLDLITIRERGHFEFDVIVNRRSCGRNGCNSFPHSSKRSHETRKLDTINLFGRVALEAGSENGDWG